MTCVSGVSSNVANNLDALASVNCRFSAENVTETTKQHRVEPTAQSNESDTSVTLSEAGKDKLRLEQQTAATDETTDLKSFAFGALGLDHPDQVEDKEDSSYTVGQYVKAAATIGGMIAMFV